MLSEIIGWVGSGLLVLSLVQPHMLALRVLNLSAAVLLVVYNVMIVAWPAVIMNIAVAGINVFYLVMWRLAQSRTDSETARRSGQAP